MQSADAARLAPVALFACLLVLGPIWWRTTSVERALLPGVEQLSGIQASMRAHDLCPAVRLNVLVSSTLDERVVAPLRAALPQGASMASVSLPASVLQAASDESGASAEVVHEALCASLNESSGSLTTWAVFVLSAPSSRAPAGCARLFVGARASFVWLSSASDARALGAFLARAVRAISDGTALGDAHVDESASGYALVLTLLDAQPEPGEYLAWPGRAVAKALQPFVGVVGALFPLSLTSRLVRHAPLPASLARTQGTRVAERDMRYMLDLNAWALDVVSPGQAEQTPVHLAVYVPARAVAPLSLQADDGSGELPGNGFVVPHWGGLTVLNVDRTKNASGAVRRELGRAELAPVVRSMISQLRVLLGLTLNVPAAEFCLALLPSPRTGVAALELAALRERRTRALARSAADTVAQLGRLAARVAAIAVPEGVAEDVRQVVQLLTGVANCSLAGDARLALAREAAKRAEAAFANPASLSLLYFPDEHKYAIYTPLGVPLAVPLLAWLVRWARAAWRRRRRQTE